MTSAFRDLDKDGDGEVDHGELQGILVGFQLTGVNAAHIIQAIEGPGGNGKVDYTEFMDWVQHTDKPSEGIAKGLAAGGVVNARNLWEQNPKVIKVATMLREKGLGKASLKTWFNAFDENRDGQVSTDELHTMLSNFGFKMKREDVQEVMDCFDVDGDGGIHFSEFVEIVQDTSEDEAFDTRKEFEDDPEESDDDLGDWVQMAKPTEKDPVVRAAQNARAQMKLENMIKDTLRKRGRMANLFRSFDDDGSGEVSTEEFTAGLQRFLWGKGLKTDKEAIDTLVAKVDMDGDGKIAYNEFFQQLGWQDGYEDTETDEATHRWKEMPPLKGGKVLTGALLKLRESLERRGYDPSMLRQLLMAFRSLQFEDIHDSVTKPEFKVALKGCSGFKPTEQELDVLVDALDIDGDGTICFREFAAAMNDSRGISIDMQGIHRSNVVRLQKKSPRTQPEVDAQQILATLHRGGLMRENSIRQTARPPSSGSIPPWLPVGASCKLPTLRHMQSDSPWQTASQIIPSECSPRKLLSPAMKAKCEYRLRREHEIKEDQEKSFAKEKKVEDARLEKCYASLSRYMKKINKVEKRNFNLGGGYGTTRRHFHGKRAEDSQVSLFG